MRSGTRQPAGGSSRSVPKRALHHSPFRSGALTGAVLLLAACGGGGGSGGSGGGSGAGPVVSTPPVVPAQPPANPPPVAGTNAAETAANYGIAQIGGDAAYSAGARGGGVKVAVIDSGISLDHSEFAGRIDTANSIDIVTGNRSTLEDQSGHGSHVAGIIAANADGTGMRGVAPSASLMAIRTDLRDDDVCSSPGCGYFDDDVAAALNHARNRGADIVNLSIGKDTPVNGAYRSALEAAVRSGALVVVAAGNQRQDDPLYPGLIAEENGIRGGMLVVGAVDSSGAIYGQTNRAGEVEAHYLVAPGVNIYSTYRDGGYRRLTGTSMAAPHVAGAAAALKSAFPSLSMREVAEILLTTADDLGAGGRDQVYGNGLINLERALAPVGRQQVAGGDTVSGQRFDVANSSLQLGAAFGDALSGSSALANGMVLDAYDRPYRADFRQAIKGNDGVVDFAGRLQRVSLTRDLPLDALAPNGVMAGLRLSEQQDRPVPGTMRAALTEPAGQSTQQIDHLMLRAGDLPAGDLRFGVGLTPSSVSSGATTASSSDLFLDAHTMLAPIDGLLAKGTGGAWHLSVSDSTALTFGVLDSESLSAPGYDTYGNEGRLFSFGADQRLGEQTSLHFDYAYVDEATALLGSSASGAFAFDDGAQSHLGTARFAYRPLASLELFAQATLGISTLDDEGGMLNDWSTVTSDAFAFGAIADSVFKEADRLGVVVGQPLRVSSASVVIDVPTGRTLDGGVERSQERVEATPNGRELRLELAYQRMLEAKRAIAGWLVLQHQPGHAEDAEPALGVGLRFTEKF